MKNILLLFCFILSALCGYSQSKDTFEVYFPYNSARINAGVKAYIDQLIFNDTLIHGDKLIILGYADYVGGQSHNDSLSGMRAANIRAYLGTMGFNKNDISLCIGKGKIERPYTGPEGYAPDRKVQIIIDRVRRIDVIKYLPLKARVPVKIVLKNQSGKIKPEPVPLNPPEKIDIEDLKVNETFALNNLHFEPGSPVLLPESKGDLEKLLTFLNDNPGVKIRIEGHVCCLGPVEGLDDRNYSYYRAVTVYNYLVNNGINKERLSTIGMGNSNPVVKNEVTEEDRIKNRRVEIRILSK